MGKHPFNLALRFILELIVLFAAGSWAWKSSTSILLTILAPVVIAAIWGIFNVKGDPSRSGKAVVKVPGIVRLLIEFLVFSSGTWFLYQNDYQLHAWLFSAVVVLHYILSFDRIKWLIKK